MAIGALAPGWLPVPTGPDASIDLIEAALPLPLDDASVVAPRAFEALFDELADPRPDEFAFAGNPGPAEDLAFLDRIHVIPRRRDLGAVVSEQEIEVEVWNAFLARAKVLDEITVEGPAGIEVIDHLGQPAHFPASDSQVYRIKVFAEGDPLIDNLITWVFVGVDPAGTNIRILGFRLVPFPFPPNWAEPVRETFGYLTDVLLSFRGMEQRIQLRAVPVGTIAYSTLLNDLRDTQMAGAILFGNQARSFGIARWQFQVPLLQDAAADDLEVFCDTTSIPFEPGGLVLLWTDPYRWEVQTIDSVLADRIVLTLGLRNPWTAGVTAVLPLVVGRLSPDEAITWESLMIASTALVFDIDGFRP